MSKTPLLSAESLTDAALPSFLFVVGVLRRVFVTLRTMSLLGIQSCRSYAPQNVLLVGYWLKMCGIDTGAIPAEMVEYKAVGDLTYQLLIGKVLCWHLNVVGDAK